MTTLLGEPETLGELISTISRTIQGSLVEPHTYLNSSIDASQTSITVTEANEQIQEGVILCVDLEQMRVTSISSTTITVQRGYTGTPATAHDSATMVQINWADPFSTIARALVQELRSWPKDLFQVRTVDVSIASSNWTDVALTDYVQGLGATLTDSRGTRDVAVEVLASTPTTDFASGSALRVLSYRDAGTLRFTYASRYGALDSAYLDTTLDALFIPSRVLDIAEYGTAWRILAGGETQRLALQNQGEPRKADEVRALQRMQGGLANKQLRDERIEEEIAELRNLYPLRF